MPCWSTPANPGKTPSRTEISERLRNPAGYKGVAALVDFEGKGDNKNAKVYLYQIQNKQYPGVQVQTAETATRAG